MALLAIEGFEACGSSNATLATYIGRRYTNSLTQYALTTGPYSNKALSIAGGNYFIIPVTNTITSFTGFAFKITTLPASETRIFEWQDAGTAQDSLEITSAGELRLRIGTAGAVFGTTSGLGIVVDTWYYIEVKLTINNTTGAYEVRVNGTNVLSGSSVDTQTTANAHITSVIPRKVTTAQYAQYDDIYVCDNLGGTNDDFLGWMKISLLTPNGDTVDQDFTPLGAGDNYVEVDELSVDDDTTYNQSATAGHKDLFDYTNTSSLGPIKGVQINTECTETDANPFTIKSVVKSGVTESADAAQAVAAAYGNIKRVVEKDPNTAALWTDTNLDAALFGYEVG